eukprot:2007429-Pleurochrysis_carterae.AAC.1
MAPMSKRGRPGRVRVISASYRMRRNASSKSGRPLASGSRSSAPHASCSSSTRPKAITPPPTPLPAS